MATSRKDIVAQLVPAHSSTRALKIVGDMWVMRILWDAFRGAKRFSDWAEVGGIPRPVLIDRLNRLVSAGVLEARPYSTRPPRHEYRLTEQGRELWAYILSLWTWDHRWIEDQGRIARTMRHHRCGKTSHAVICCAECGEAAARLDIAETPGPGARLEPRLKPRWQRRSALKPKAQGVRDFSDQLMRIVGDRWSTALLAAVNRGDGTFGDLQRRLHISSHLLSERLKELVLFDVMERVAYGVRPERLRYRLKPKGEALLLSHWLLMRWGDRWLAGADGPPLLAEHKVCKRPFAAELHCSECGGTLRPGNFSFEPDVSLQVHRAEPAGEGATVPA